MSLRGAVKATARSLKCVLFDEVSRLVRIYVNVNLLDRRKSLMCRIGSTHFRWVRVVATFGGAVSRGNTYTGRKRRDLLRGRERRHVWRA